MDPKALDFFEKKQPFGLFWARGRKGELTEVFNKHVHVPPPSPPGRLYALDVGFGRVDELFSLLDFLPECVLVGLDVYGQKMKGMARATKELGHLRVARGELPAIDFDDAYFHLVCALDVLPVVPDIEGSLASLRRILKPKGHFLFATGFSPEVAGEKKFQARVQPYERAGIPLHVFSLAGWKEKIEAAGFKAEKTFTTKSGLGYVWATTR